MKTYTPAEINEKLESGILKDWKSDSGVITRELIFKDFKEAMAFMIKAGDMAETMNHHPDWTNAYNKLSIRLSTHEAGGVTDKDFELAEKMEKMMS